MEAQQQLLQNNGIDLKAQSELIKRTNYLAEQVLLAVQQPSSSSRLLQGLPKFPLKDMDEFNVVEEVLAKGEEYKQAMVSQIHLWFLNK